MKIKVIRQYRVGRFGDEASEEMEWQDIMDEIHEDAAVLWDQKYGHLDLDIDHIYCNSRRANATHPGSGACELICDRNGFTPNFFRFYHGKDWRGWCRVQDGVRKDRSGKLSPESVERHGSGLTNEFLFMQVANELPKWLRGEGERIAEIVYPTINEQMAGQEVYG